MDVMRLSLTQKCNLFLAILEPQIISTNNHQFTSSSDYITINDVK